MNNARKTFNLYLSGVVAGISGFAFYTGNEKNPRRDPPYVSINWIDGHRQGLKPESRSMMCDIQVWTAGADESKLDATCESILTGLGLRIGSFPIATIPKKNLSAGQPGTLLNTQMILSLLVGQGWKNIPTTDQATRAKSLALMVDYIPG